MPKTIFITGASSGIGLACAEKFAEKGYRLILTARRKDKLQEISNQLSQRYSSEILNLVFDVRDKQEVSNVVNSLPGNWSAVDVLINNAGLAVGLDSVHDGNTDDWERMIDANIKGLLYVSKALTPGMIKRMSGHIFNIGSIAAKDTYMKGGVYCGTKHAVDSITKAQRMELLPYNIKVTLINPGATDTEFSLVRFKGDEKAAKNVYKGFQPLDGEDVAQCIYFCASRPAHVTINDMLIMPTAQASASVFHKD